MDIASSASVATARARQRVRDVISMSNDCYEGLLWLAWSRSAV